MICLGGYLGTPYPIGLMSIADRGAALSCGDGLPRPRRVRRSALLAGSGRQPPHVSARAANDNDAAEQARDAYDAENRLISATGAASASLVYDPLGRLWQTSGGSAGVTDFLHDGDEIALEYDGAGGILRRYLWGPGVDEPILWDEGGALTCGSPGAPTTFALHADHQGSVIARANCWGNRVGVNAYDEHGVPAAANAGPFQYTGQACWGGRPRTASNVPD